MRPFAKILLTLLSLVTPLLTAQQPATPRPAQPFDVVILHGHIIDGTGSPWYSGDIGIRNGRIAAIGNLSAAPAKQTIDAHGLVVAPGFIDMLGQSELTMLVDPRVPSKIFQGITTEITGEGNSAGPINDATIAADRADYDHYHLNPELAHLRPVLCPPREARHGHQPRQLRGRNLRPPHGPWRRRRAAHCRAARPDEGPGRQAMRDGAMGLSTALQYTPAPYAKTEELIALASEASKFGGIYSTHMRSEGDQVLESIDEAARIGREAHIPVEIWHLKAAGKANWGKMPQIVAKIDGYRAAGLDITADTYAYTAWFNTFSAFVPPWAHDGGDVQLIARLKDPATRARIRRDMTTSGKDSAGEDWDNEWQEIPGPDAILVAVVQNPELAPLQGKRLSEVAALWHEDPIDALCDLLIKDKAFTEVAVFGMDEPDVKLALQQPWVSVDNDSSGTSPEGLLGTEHPHPRAYGTFPRILRKYVREEHALTLPDAIRKFSALPAQRLRLTDRGVLKQGLAADVVVFDPATITDKSTYENPNQFSTGMEYVLVNGVPVIANGKMTGALPGKVLRGPGYVQ